MRLTRTLIAGSALVLFACSEAPEPMAPDGVPQAARVPGQTGTDQAELARQIPEFGGFFLDEQGRPTAYVTNTARAEAVRGQLGALARSQGFAPEDIVFQQARYSWAQLDRGFERATHAAMPLAGSVFTDLDEARNLVVVGVEHAGLVNGARAALAAAGLEAGSYDVIVTPPIHQAATLRDRFATTQGGIQIHFTQYLCTMGANVYDDTQRSFITNSHCTATQGGVENTAYYQPTSSVDGTVIANEVEDPVYTKGGTCPRGKKCRRSDSSRALYTGARPSADDIALTSGPNNGSLAVTGAVDVAGKSNNVVVGTVVNKVGRTTGWTQAAVSRTCVNTGVQGSQILQLCQHWVQSSAATIVGSGDSGSGVWTGNSSSATLVGLLWGGSSDNRTFIFSPMSGIEAELGPLTVTF